MRKQTYPCNLWIQTADRVGNGVKCGAGNQVGKQEKKQGEDGINLVQAIRQASKNTWLACK